MKKYFLLISLFALMFLGLGNYTNATDCGSIPQKNVGENDVDFAQRYAVYANCIASNSCTCTVVNGTSMPSCPSGWTPSPNICSCFKMQPGSTLPDVMSCTQNNPTITPCTNPAKANAHINAIGACVCNDGFKDINHVCEPCNKEGVCCGIELNTSIPFIGKCIETTPGTAYKSPDETGVTGEEAFPVLMGSLVKILVTVILIISFVLIIVGGIMIATGNPAEGKKMIIKVAVGIALLGASGVILRLINPNFFG